MSRTSRVLEISPRFRVKGGYLKSVCGPLKTVAHYAHSQKWHPHNIVAFGQNGAMPGMKKEDIQAHVLVVVGAEAEAVHVTAKIPHSILSASMQDGFDYANMMAEFKNHVRLVNFGKAFKTNPFAEHITNIMFDGVFYQNGAVFQSAPMGDARALLLVGTGGPRTICVTIPDQEDAFKVLPCAHLDDVVSRHTLIGSCYLLASAFKGSTVFALRADALRTFILDPESIPPVWSSTHVGYCIEDLGLVDGSKDTALMTVMDQSARYIPLRLSETPTKRSLVAEHLVGLSRSDMSDYRHSPIVRVAQDGQVILVDNEEMLFVRLTPARMLGEKFQKLIAYMCKPKTHATSQPSAF